MLAVALGAAAASPGRTPLLVLAALFGLAGVTAVWLLAPGSLADLSFLAFFASLSIPLDKYFAFQPHVGGWPGVRVAVADLGLLLLLPLALLGIALGRLRPSLPWPVTAAYMAWFGLSALSVVGSFHPRLGLFELASMAHAFVIAWTVAVVLRRALIVPVLVLLASQVWLHTLFAAVQVATGRPIGRTLFGGSEEVMREVLVSGAARLRPAGLFDHPIVYADFIMLSLPLMAAWACAADTAWSRRLALLTSGVALVGLGLTLSRGAWISTAVAGAVLLVLAHRRGLIEPGVRRRLLRGALLFLPIGMLLAPMIYERLARSQSGNLDVRFELNEIAWRVVAARPLGGIGLNSFIETMEAYDTRNVMRYFPATVHNLYLLEASECGLPALAALLALMATVARSAWRRNASVPASLERWLSLAVLAGLGGLAVSQLADFSHRIEPLRTIVWALVGLLFGMLRVPAARPLRGAA